MQIRSERPEDTDAIRSLTTAAFRDMLYSSQTEAMIVDALRDAGALTISLVAVQDGDLVGHVAFSPVAISDGSNGWYGLGPVSVRPDQQRKGIGLALIHEGLDRLQHIGAQGCVVLGDPGYYSRFGFRNDPHLRYADAPPEYFQCLGFTATFPRGEASYHPGFGAS
ncbi:GNAT family N-acetyltransferase [Azospirillum sp. CT11-132]|uniref:GNAT family N-acetyltransferase n=1 Tax=Azospirillum sp. CT11-132 TaxID=3396317 RepID=UPI0039A4EA7C